MVSAEALNEKMETSDEESNVMGESIKVEIEMEDEEQEILEAKESPLSSKSNNEKSDIANVKVNEKYWKGGKKSVYPRPLCPDCGKDCSRLSTHRLTKHTCKTCQEYFKNPLDLKAHKETHKQKTFSCDQHLDNTCRLKVPTKFLQPFTTFQNLN